MKRMMRLLICGLMIIQPIYAENTIQDPEDKQNRDDEAFPQSNKKSSEAIDQDPRMIQRQEEQEVSEDLGLELGNGSTTNGPISRSEWY